MNQLQKYVRTMMTDAQRTECIANYEELEKEGAIGDCLLRTTAENYYKALGTYSNVVMNMGTIAFECYRYFYWRNRKEGY